MSVTPALPCNTSKAPPLLTEENPTNNLQNKLQQAVIPFSNTP